MVCDFPMTFALWLDHASLLYLHLYQLYTCALFYTCLHFISSVLYSDRLLFLPTISLQYVTFASAEKSFSNKTTGCFAGSGELLTHLLLGHAAPNPMHLYQRNPLWNPRASNQARVAGKLSTFRQGFKYTLAWLKSPKNICLGIRAEYGLTCHPASNEESERGFYCLLLAGCHQNQNIRMTFNLSKQAAKTSFMESKSTKQKAY